MTVLDSDAAGHPRPPLGVGALFGETGRMLTGSFAALAGTAILLFCVLQVVSFAFGYLLVRSGIPLLLRGGEVDAASVTPASIVATILFGIFAFLASAAIYCAVTSVAVRIGLRQPTGAAVVFGDTVRLGVPFLVASAMALFLVVGGFAALVLPGVWVAGVYSVLPAVVVAERRRWGALRRTAQLTKDYRWPLIGFFVLIYVVVALVGGLIGIVATVPRGQGGTGYAWTVVELVLNAVANGLGAAILSAAAVLAYRRLVAIKEGGGADELRAVFE